MFPLTGACNNNNNSTTMGLIMQAACVLGLTTIYHSTHSTETTASIQHRGEYGVQSLWSALLAHWHHNQRPSSQTTTSAAVCSEPPRGVPMLRLRLHCDLLGFVVICPIDNCPGQQQTKTTCTEADECSTGIYPVNLYEVKELIKRN